MFTKKKKIKLVANAHSTGLIELFPLEKSAMPKFFNKLPKHKNYNNENINVRVCSGLLDLYNKSISVPAWQDIKINVNSNGEVMFDAPQPEWAGVSHDIEVQASGAWPGYINAKLISPWIIECNADVQWTVMQNVWNQQNPEQFLVVPGNLEFKYQNQSNIHLLIKIPERGSKTIEIKAGDPLALLIPNFNSEYELSHTYIDQLKWTKLANSRWIFSKGPSYARLRSLLRNKNK